MQFTAVIGPTNPRLQFLLFVFVLASVASATYAAITVDPSGTGATDVTGARFTQLIPLPEPLPDPLQINHDLVVGHTSVGEIRIDDGSQVTSVGGIVGDQVGSSGIVTLDGASTHWTNNGTLAIGRDAEGVVNVLGGASIDNRFVRIGESEGSIGQLMVDGSDTVLTSSRDMSIGSRGNGTIRVQNGATLDIYRAAIGVVPGSQGFAVIDGAGSTWSTQFSVTVGTLEESIGRLEILNGASLSTRHGYVGDKVESNGEVILDGAGSSWTNSLDFYIGEGGTGNFVVSNGAAASGRDTYIGFESGSNGTLTVDGTDSQWGGSGSLYVGHDGSAALTISNGGIVTAGTDTRVGFGQNSSGSIAFDNGTLDTGTLYASTTDLSGTGTVRLNGIVSDVNLRFDATSGVNPTVVLADSAGQNVTLEFTFDGTGDLSAGFRSSSSLEILEGTVVESRNGYVGYHSGSNGTTTIDGVGSTWAIARTGQFHVGVFGEGSLSIRDGGILDADFNNGTSVGSAADSLGEIAVSGSGSEFRVSNVEIGREGQGILTVEQGGYATSSTMSIANLPGSVGAVVVDGLGSRLSASSSLFVGRSGQGTLQISDGSTVAVNKSTFVGFDASGTGSISFDNGTLETGTLLAGADQLHGTGTILARGLVSDFHLTLNATIGKTQTLHLSEFPGQNIQVELDIDNYNSMGAGYRGVGSLTVSEGFVLNSEYGYLGYHAGSSGVASFSDNGTLWNIDDDLYIGRDGEGSLTISNGAIVSNELGTVAYGDNSIATVVVDGPGSTWTSEVISSRSSSLDIGYNGDGTLVISNGGLVESKGGHVGVGVNSRSRVTVLGPGSIWTNTGELVVGVIGQGEMSVGDGGSVSSVAGSIGRNAGSSGSVTVEGMNSVWNIADDLRIGVSGTGNLNVANGGAVNIVADTLLGPNSSISVDGTNSTFESYRLFLGNSGIASLSITDGGLTTSDYNYVGYDTGSAVARIEGVGSKMAVNRRFFVGGIGSGKIILTNGGEVDSPDRAYVGGNVGYSGSALIDGPGTLWTSGFLLSVGGAGEGRFTLSGGGLARVAGTLSISSNGSVDLANGGMLALFGDADVSVVHFLDLANGTDAIRYWDHDLLEWSHITNATLGADYTLEYQTTGDLAGYTLLTVGSLDDLPELPGDFNNDGSVDLADYTVWRNNLGATLSLPNETWTLGEVTAEDYDIWKQNYGRTLVGNSQAVPEPGALGLCILAAGAMLAGRAPKSAAR